MLKADPWGDCLMLDIEPSILHPIIDRLLPAVPAGRAVFEPTVTEMGLLRMATRVVRLFLEEFRAAWRNVLDLRRLDALQAESNPRLMRILPADEAVIVVCFALAVGGQRGTMRLCLPCRAVELNGEPATSPNPSSPRPAPYRYPG